MSPFKIVFIHGYTSSSGSDFYPRLSKMLFNAGIDFIIPDLPGGKNPHSEIWMREIADSLKGNTKPLIFVGHSLGTRAVLLYLEQFKLHIEKAFLIAAFANDLANAARREGLAYPDFFTHKINLDIVKQLSREYYVVHSMDDPSIAYSQGEQIAGQLNAKLLTFSDKGHFYKPENADTIFNILAQYIPFSI